MRHLRNKLDRPFDRARDRDAARRGLPAAVRRWLTPGQVAPVPGGGSPVACGCTPRSQPSRSSVSSSSSPASRSSRCCATRSPTACATRPRSGRTTSPARSADGGLHGRRSTYRPTRTCWCRSSTAPGSVSAASPNVAGDSPMAAIPAGSSAWVDDVPVRDDDEVEGEDLLVVARRVHPAPAAMVAGMPALILVGRTLESVDESVTLTMRSLLVGIPVLLVVVGLVTWLIVGRALAPVDATRAEVAEISDRDLHRRVPEPPTGRRDRAPRARRSTPCSPGSRMRRPGSAGSSPTRRTSCGARWRASATTPRSRSPIPRARRSRSSHATSSPRICASSSSSTTSPGSPGPTSTHRQHRAPTVDLDDLVLDEARPCATRAHRAVDTAAVSAGRVNGDAGQLRRLSAQPARQRGASRAQRRDRLAVADVANRWCCRSTTTAPASRAPTASGSSSASSGSTHARSRDAGGSGLGLAIAAEITAMHNGSISVTDAPGGGARFEVRLPSAP